MVFNGGLIPQFLLVDFLNLRNTIFALFVPTLINGWYFLIMRNFFMNIPKDLKYTEDHEWVKIEGNIATVGITDFAQGDLGDIKF